MNEILYFGNEITFIFKLIIAILIGFAIGFERESKGKDAGISTHTLVVIGSMIFTYLSIHASGSDSTTRIAAQIVTGIGFLGAGLILRDGTSVRNLTTAASLWFSAAVGMAIGFDFYIIAIISGFVGLFVLRIPHMTQKGLRKNEHDTHDNGV